MDWIKSVAIFRAALNGLWKEIIKQESPRLRALFLTGDAAMTPEQRSEERLWQEVEALRLSL